MRRTSVIISSVFLASALVLMGYFILRGSRNTIADPYRAVSRRAFMVIETRDLQSFLNSATTGKGIFGEITRISQISSFNSKLKFLADEINKPVIREAFGDGISVISFYPTSNGRVNALVSVAVSENTGFRELNRIISASGVKSAATIKIKGKQALAIPYSNGNSKDTVYLVLGSGLLIASESRSVIRESLETMAAEKDIRGEAGFTAVLNASGDSEDKFFLVFGNLQEILENIFTRQGSELLNKIATIATVSSLDIFSSDAGLILSGYLHSNDSSGTLSRFNDVQPAELQTYKILPASTVSFETFRLSGKKATSNSFPGSFICRYLGDEVTRAKLDLRESGTADTVTIYRITNAGMAEQEFTGSLGVNLQTLYFTPDDQIKVPVYRIPSSSIFDFSGNHFSNNSDTSYFAFYDQYLIAGNSFITVSKVLYDNILKHTLVNDLKYREFMSTLPSRSTYMFYCIPSRVTGTFDGLIRDEIMASIRENQASFEKIQALGYMLSPGNKMFYNSLSIRFKPDLNPESRTEWETLLDTTAAIKPFIFTNHLTGAKEIFVQDCANNIYLINVAGRVLWKVPLNERITGDIYMIDFFGNRKYQILFSGKNFLHLIDRNGNYVERYPLKLRSPATNPMALLDYDDNGKYRILIAGEDRNIYAYDKSGNTVKGWKAFTTAGKVLLPVQYFSVSGKDYITVADDESIYLLDRYGNKRLTFKEPVKRAAGSSLELVEGRDTYLVCSSPDGTVAQLYFDGSVRKLNLGTFSPGHSFDLFDIDGDGNGEYVFLDKGKLSLFDHDRSLIFTKVISSSKLTGPICFSFSANEKCIGVLDAGKNRIYLFNGSGETEKGFPLKGVSLFSIFKPGEKSGWHLFVGGADNFLYNYKLENLN